MENIYTKDYAVFMEETLKALVALPVEGLCIVAKLKGGATMTNYFKSGMMDKIAYAGVIQQESMLEMLQANGLVPEDPKKDEE